MLGLLLIYFIGKRFYDLAETHGKKKWPYTILGIASYYGGTILFGFGFGIVAVSIGYDHLLDMNEYLLGLMALPFGILVCWLVYRYLRSTWEKDLADLGIGVQEFGQTDKEENFEH